MSCSKIRIESASRIGATSLRHRDEELISSKHMPFTKALSHSIRRKENLILFMVFLFGFIFTIELLPVPLMPLCPNWSLKGPLILPTDSSLLSYCSTTIV